MKEQGPGRVYIYSVLWLQFGACIALPWPVGPYGRAPELALDWLTMRTALPGQKVAVGRLGLDCSTAANQ